MADRSEEIVEATFLIPIKEDEDVGSGELHPHFRWEAIQKELFEKYGGWTMDTALKMGVYPDPDKLIPVFDKSREYRVAIRRKDLDTLRESIRCFAILFRQKCIYFTVAGVVEFIEGEEDEKLYDA